MLESKPSPLICIQGLQGCKRLYLSFKITISPLQTSGTSKHFFTNLDSPGGLVFAGMTEHTETAHFTPPLNCQAWIAVVFAGMTEHTETAHFTPPLNCQAWIAASATPITEVTAETPSAVLAFAMFGLEFHPTSLRRIIHQLNTMLAIDEMIEAVLIGLELLKTHVSTILRTREGMSWFTKSNSILQLHGWEVSMKSLYGRSPDGLHR